MWPPLLRVVIHEPSLLARYAAGYATLIGQEAATWQAHLKRRLVLLFLLIVCVGLVLTLGGIALMLFAVTGTAHWLLWATPALPLLGVLFTGASLAREQAAPPGFTRLRDQFDKDMQLFGLKDTDE